MRRIRGIDVFGRDSRVAGAQRSGWDESAYLDAVEATLSRVRRTFVGRYVLGFVEMSRHAVRVYPEPEGRDPDDPPYVSALVEGGGAVVAGRPGSGCDADLFFTPRDYHVFTEREARSRGPGRFADELLLHELVHALRCTWGTLDRQQLPLCMRGYDNFEELCAITVTNLYRSELRRPLIAFHRVGPTRRDVRSPNAERDPRAQWERKLLTRFLDQMPYFVRPLTRLPEGIVADNPFRLYLTDRLEHVPVVRDPMRGQIRRP